MNLKSKDAKQEQIHTFLYSGAGVGILAGLFIVSRFNFLVFHGLANYFPSL